MSLLQYLSSGLPRLLRNLSLLILTPYMPPLPLLSWTNYLNMFRIKTGEPLGYEIAAGASALLLALSLPRVRKGPVPALLSVTSTLALGYYGKQVSMNTVPKDKIKGSNQKGHHPWGAYSRPLPFPNFYLLPFLQVYDFRQ